jgi:L-fucose dehydrogenase
MVQEFMNLNLQGKVILISGGARGIGAAIVRACVKEGATPVILDRDERAIRELQAELSNNEVKTEGILVELMDDGQVFRAVEVIGQKFEHIDGLVNNAGTNDGVGLEHGSPGLFFKSLQLNLVHFYTLTHSALPFLKKSQGSIVNIASKVAITGQGYVRLRGSQRRDIGTHLRLGSGVVTVRRTRERRCSSRGLDAKVPHVGCAV